MYVCLYVYKNPLKQRHLKSTFREGTVMKMAVDGN